MRVQEAAKRGVTAFPNQVKSDGQLIISAKDNNKLGKNKTRILKGKWKGMPLYQLTLEERATCPRSCPVWDSCYGNRMPFAHRRDHKRWGFLHQLKTEVAQLAHKHVEGFVVRLHVLGDFYSISYTNTWKRLLEHHPELRVYGYTHRWPGTEIGDIIHSMNGPRCWIRFSDLGGPMSANVIDPTMSIFGEDRLDTEGIICPEQTGKTQSCLTCGLCWGTIKPIRFLKH